jgi:hypothetical protein
MSMKVEYRYSMSMDEARERLRALGEYFFNKHGINVTWDGAGNSAQVRGKYMVVTFEGTMVLKEGVAIFDGKDPGFLLRGKAKDYLLGKLKKYLDPATPVASLPRN